MFQEWANRGVHLWKVKIEKVPLVEGQAEYSYATDSTNFPNDISSVLEAYYRNNSTTTAPQDIALTQISRSTYNATPNKLVKGTPSQFYIERKELVDAIKKAAKCFLWYSGSFSNVSKTSSDSISFVKFIMKLIYNNILYYQIFLITFFLLH